MIGTLVNTIAVLVGAIFGLLFKKGIPKKLEKNIFTALGLAVLYVGISGTLKEPFVGNLKEEGNLMLIVILSMVFGSIVGELLNLDGALNKLGQWFEKKFANTPSESGSFAHGFVTASLVFCVGAMSVVGPIEDALIGSRGTLYTKSLLDAIGAVVFASSMDIGVLFSSLFILIYQGSIALLALVMGQALSSVFTPIAVAEMGVVGSLLIVAIGTNLLSITKIKVMNLLPAIFFPLLLSRFM